MTFRKLILFSVLTVLLGIGIVYAFAYEFNSGSSSPSTGTLSVSAYYAARQPDGTYEGSYVQVPITVTGSESYNGTTTANESHPLNFTVKPGEYSVHGTYNETTSLTATASVSTGNIVKIVLDFGPSSASSVPITATGTSEWQGLALTMTLEKTEYGLGEPVNISLTIANISNQTTTFGLSAWNNFDFQVFKDTGTYNGTSGVIYQYSDFWIGQIIPQIVLGETLGPGESLSQSFVWNQTYPIATGASEGLPVSPGTYYVVGLIGSVLSTKTTLETTPIQINIT